MKRDNVRLGAGVSSTGSTGVSASGVSAVFVLVGRGILVVSTSLDDSTAIGKFRLGSGTNACPNFLVGALASDGGGTVSGPGLSTCFVGRGVVTGSATGGVGGEPTDLRGTVFAVSAFIKDGNDAFFASGCAGRGAPAEAGKEGGAGGGTPVLLGSDLVGSGAVWAAPLTIAARDTFFVPWRGEVVATEEADCPTVEGAPGAIGPSRPVFLTRALTIDGRDSLGVSWRLEGKCVTPGGVDGALF